MSKVGTNFSPPKPMKSSFSKADLETAKRKIAGGRLLQKLTGGQKLKMKMSRALGGKKYKALKHALTEKYAKQYGVGHKQAKALLRKYGAFKALAGGKAFTKEKLGKMDTAFADIQERVGDVRREQVLQRAGPSQSKSVERELQSLKHEQLARADKNAQNAKQALTDNVDKLDQMSFEEIHSLMLKNTEARLKQQQIRKDFGLAQVNDPKMSKQENDLANFKLEYNDIMMSASSNKKSELKELQSKVGEAFSKIMDDDSISNQEEMLEKYAQLDSQINADIKHRRL